MPLAHVALGPQCCTFIMNTPFPAHLFNGVEVELDFCHPLHVPSIGLSIIGSDAPISDPSRPHSYYLIRIWECNCVARSHKRKTIHRFQLSSPLFTEIPDSRVYHGLCQIEGHGSQEEPLHARFYRGNYTRIDLQTYYVEGTVSEFIDVTNTCDIMEIPV
jgi:hypothetical protein